MSNVKTLKRLIRQEIRGIYTVTFARVEDVDDDRRAVVSLKSNNDIIIDNVPIASTWARDGAGIVVPVERGDEGLILHAQEPLEKQIQERGEQDPESDRRFQLEDAVFMPMLWLGSDDVPDHEDGELVVKHESGTEFRLDDDGVHVEPELYVDGIPFTEHVHDYSWDDEGGSDETSPPSEN